MKWLQANAAVVFTLLVVAWLGCALVRALVIRWRRRDRSTAAEDLERAEQVRQQIRRKITERRANPAGSVTAPESRSVAARPTRGVRPLDPFGGPRRWWMRLRDWWQRRT